MAENEQSHFHNTIKREERRKDRGQIFGFIIILTAIVGGIGLVALDKNIIGFGMFFTGLAALVLAYIYGKKSFFHNNKEDKQLELKLES